MSKEFKRFGDECPKCGSEAEVLTTAPVGYAHDGDLAQCVECGHEGSVSCDGDENDNGDTVAFVQWNDYEEED
jgi:transcription elongation factor Elf1